MKLPKVKKKNGKFYQADLQDIIKFSQKEVLLPDERDDVIKKLRKENED